MSYRVDIPTLSANEVYTLTFEYEGTETIQLIVGDLTLETTDRRVVFTTTSPVNYIESNVNLTNLNMYEGYYESDDFGGEYTQESYIEGKSLVNYHDFNRCNLTLNNETQGKWEFLDDGFARMTTLDITYNHCRPKPTNYTSEGIYTVATWVRNFNSEAGNVMFECFHYLDTIKTINLDGSVITGNDSGTHYYSTGQEGLMISVGKYTGITQKIVNGTHHQYMGNFGTSGGFVSGDSVEIFVMVLEGDKADDILNGLIQPFHGIGCVKSPKVISREQPLNMFYCTNWTSTLNRGTVTCQDGKFYFDGSFSGYTWFDIINGGEVKNNIYLEPGSYYAKMKAHSKEPCASNGVCVSIEATMENGITMDLCSVYTSKDNMYNGVVGVNKQFTSPIVSLKLKIWYGGNGSNNIIIDGIYIGKTDTTNDLAFKESHVVSTPDDLKMYELPTKWGDSHDGDRLDLTTGILTKKIENLIIDNATWSPETHLGKVVPNSAGTHYECKISYAFLRDTKYNGASNNPQKGIFFKNGCSLPVRVETQYINMDIPISMLSEATIDNYLAFLDGGEIIYFLATHRTEQLSLNPLKSYRNGSIQISSQQLAPTLKTTLPISNKFTTTNLTSGSTYNVYFDGTATKLDAGGTIITNPVSPCEVECGGTTLTIEGTDIQNVRVLETTNKNEVGSVNGTTDVELSRVITSDLEVITNDIEFSSVGTDNGNINTVDNKLGTINTKGGHSWGAGYFTSNKTYPKGFSLLHIEFDVNMPSNNLMAIINFNNNVSNTYYNFRDLTLDNDTATIAQGQTSGIEVKYSSIVTKGHFSRLVYCFSSQGKINLNINTGSSAMLTASGNNAEGSTSGYTACANNGITISNFKIKVIENYPDATVSSQITSSLRTDNGLTVIWQDMDMSIGQSISDLEQPIKLRSLGTTYDSYNPVTGELTKRIGVSETDGSYSVLSSPIVSQVEIDNIPHLYTNGQVKVYSDSEVYPTTILNGQSTNNYEVNELKTSNNYTIRYEGECESINLNGKSNEQGTNRIVKTSTNGSGNLTFVNDSGDIDNVLLVQNDVREQEINHFTGLQTVEVSGMLIETSQNMWWNDWIAPSQYGASYQVDSPEFISVQPSETIYVVADNNNYTSLFEFDENYNIVNQSNNLILGYGSVPTPIRLDNGYYKNYRILSENTRYIKFTIPASTASNAKNETRWSVISFTRADIGNVPLYTNNTPYRGSIINFPQPVQLNSLPDGTCDTYNPITGEYVQNVGYFALDDTFTSRWLIVKTKDGKPVAQRDLSTQEPHYNTLVRDYSFPQELYDYQTGTKAIANIPLVYNIDHTSSNIATPSLYGSTYFGNYYIRIALPFTPSDLDQWNYSYTQVNNWLKENPIHIVYKRTEPITTQLTPINIPTFDGGQLQLITTDGKVFPMIEYSMPTNNRYDTSSWETGAVYTQRNMTEAYFNESTTPMTPTETMTLTTDHISSGSIILNDNGNGLIVLKGNYTGRDIPYFTGMRSVEAIEVETTPSPDQPLFGKGGRK